MKNPTDDDDFSQKKLLHLLGKIPILSLSRNKPCSCGSGKIYKKCCQNKELVPKKDLNYETFAIKEEALTPEEAKSPYQQLEGEDLFRSTMLF